ncbi:MAG: molybdopterin cofactor-binding domain-containing protein [Steroidobacteraceae bacterium]
MSTDDIRIGRRTLLKAGVATAGGLVLGFQVWPTRPALAAARTSEFVPSAFIRIDGAGKVTLTIPSVEMGQGPFTSLSMILAEELDAAFDQIAVEAAPPNEPLYKNPMFQVQATGNSNSIRAFWEPMRKAAAGAREMLVQAAAQTWKVDAASLSTADGNVMHAASGRKLGYGALVARAGTLKPPAEPKLKAKSEFKLIGKSLKRVDTPEKSNGRAQYGIDAMPKGVKFATVAACPVFGGTVGGVDAAAAKAVPGVSQVLVFNNFVAVVGDHYWAAKKGLNALNISWNEGANANVDQAQVWKQIEEASAGKAAIAKTVGDVEQALKQGERVDAEYRMPFLAHAPLEPINCTVHVRKDGCEIWVGTQVAARTQAVAMQLCGLPADKVIVHNLYIGGGFGRRLDVDGIEQAVLVAQKVDAPVKVVRSREEDMQHEYYRPVYFTRLSASLAGGKITGWQYRVTGSSILARWLPPAFQNGIDFDAVDSAVDVPYEIPHLRVEYVRDEPPAVPTGFWRGVGPNNNVFTIESFIDELALKANQDPVAFRRGMLDKQPRLKAAMELAASKAGWGQAMPSRTGRGIAVQVAFASFIATVADVEVDEQGEVRVKRLVCAVDTGTVVNPDTVVAQLEGGLIFGLTAALYGEITIARGRVEQSNFHDYRMLRINETPAIEVHLIPSDQPPGGIGETGTTASPPAVANAIFAATGIRLRRMPIDRNLLAGRKSKPS